MKPARPALGRRARADERLAGEPPPLAVEAARTVLARAREEIRAGARARRPGRAGAARELAAARRARAAARAERDRRDRAHEPRPRAARREAALERVRRGRRAATRTSSTTSRPAARGSRQDHVAGLLRRLTGAEAALVVNNNAAAVLLALAALAEGREVLVSRGELIEIGDGFRIPDVLARSGARLRRGRHDEPHARRRLRARDRPRDGGAAARAPVELPRRRLHRAAVGGGARRGRRARTGCRSSTTSAPGVLVARSSGEPSARESLAAGADLVCFSGDKLLGGPQAGIVVGRAELVERLRRHPLQRALRADKLTLARARGDARALPRSRAGAARGAGAADAARAARGGARAGRAAGRRRSAARSRRRSAASAAARCRSPSCRASPARSRRRSPRRSAPASRRSSASSATAACCSTAAR